MFAVYSPPVLLATAEHRAPADTSPAALPGMMCQPPFTVTTSGPAPLTAALADALQAQCYVENKAPSAGQPLPARPVGRGWLTLGVAQGIFWHCSSLRRAVLAEPWWALFFT